MLVWATHHLVALATTAGVIGVVGIVLALIALSVAGSARKRSRRRVPTETGHPSDMYDNLQTDIRDLQNQIIELQRELEDARVALKQKVGTPSIMRYNAFGDTGSDLSFSVALVDESKTGFVISSIYGREESRTYAKPVLQGESKYQLTEEELSVLRGNDREDSGARRRKPLVTQP